ncbi:cytochrome P450 302a1, mitochondrial-like [Limulus polyphemus]|uniref:Cytochrome P450 302a1, mitochondrial-like n=1 Tax=Limulus polyphemus TaxID=6850 RepID=A0ABM1TMV9_LIMPO|nr:cytochrome P450 302a1, mitochondrial-like [Limulus polyphemus]
MSSGTGLAVSRSCPSLLKLLPWRRAGLYRLASETPCASVHVNEKHEENLEIQVPKHTHMAHGCRSPLPFSSIPGPWPSLPLVGTGWQYFPWGLGQYDIFKLHEANYDKYKRYGQIFKEEFQWRHPVVQVFNPTDFETIFRRQGRCPLRPVNQFLTYYRLSNPEKYTSVGLANAVGEEWYRLRIALAPVLLKMKTLHHSLPILNDISNDMISLLKNLRDDKSHKLENLQEALYRLVLEFTWMLCLERRLGCLNRGLVESSDGAVMISAVQKLFEAYHELYFGLPLWKYFSTASYRKLDEAESDIYDWRSFYCKFYYLNYQLTIIDFIAGGVFTTGNAIVLLLYHMAKNPDVQERLYQEICQVAPDGEITSERLARMPYLKACVKESFRLSPTIPGIMRILPEDVCLSGYQIPAGTPIFTQFMVTCQLPQYFPNPHKFYPERWMGALRKQIHPFIMLPFGYGFRMCAGRRLAEMEMYTTLAKIVYNFRLEHSGEDVDLICAFVIVPSKPVALILRDR